MNAQTKIEASISSAYVAAFAEIEGAAKDAKNPHFKTKYADLPAVIAAIKPALTKHGLAFTQPCQPSEDGVTVRTVLHHSSGETLDLGSLFVPANKRDAQGFGSALTYARRYALVSAFGVPTEDDDGNAASSSMRNQPRQSSDKSDDGAKKPSKTTVQKGLKELTHHMGSIANLAEWYQLKNKYADLIGIVERDYPDWWNGWPEQPDGFTPLRRKIEMLEADLSSSGDGPLDGDQIPY